MVNQIKNIINNNIHNFICKRIENAEHFAELAYVCRMKKKQFYEKIHFSFKNAQA